MRGILIYAFSALYCVKLFAQVSENQSQREILDRYLTSAQVVNKFNGLALVARDGEIILMKGYGYRNTATHTLNDSLTIFQMGSITKSFTAIVILKLQEEGRLSIDDKISKFIPDFPHGDKISVRNLLTHTSGLYNYTDDIDEADSAITGYPVTEERVLRVFKDKKLRFTPGKKYEYNNSGYFLLGVIIEKLTGKKYEEVVRETILAPLGMVRSGFDFKNLRDPDKAQGYVILNSDTNRVNHSVDSTVYFSAGGLYSTAPDMFKWIRAIAGHQLLNANSWSQAFTPYKEDYGLGFFIDSLNDEICISHSGGLLGFTDQYLYYPKAAFAIILLNNVGDYGNSLMPAANGISSILFGKPYADWQKPTSALTLTESVLQNFTGTYRITKEHALIVDMKNGELFVRATNPKDQLPRVRLYALSQNEFYMKEAPLKFKFIQTGNSYKLVTYTTEKKVEEWIKIK